MDTLATVVIANLGRINTAKLPLYEAILTNAVDSSPPPFAENWFGRRYFELATRADWFAQSLVANAALEGYGARQIWKFADRVADDGYAQAVRKHALDESRHSTMFVAMLRMVFPGATIDDASDGTLRDLQPRFSSRSHPPIQKRSERELYSGARLLDELVQVHITEIRALVLQYLLRSALLAYAEAPYRSRLEKMSSSLIRDESRHIEYTAKIFEVEAQKGNAELLFSTFSERLAEFNDLTLLELERDDVTI